MPTPMWGLAYPLFAGHFEQSGTVTIDHAAGTGFVPADGVLITCAHCVPDDGWRYFAAVRAPHEPAGLFAPLEDVTADERGYDLATARVPLSPEMTMSLLATDLSPNDDALAVGFPYVNPTATKGGVNWQVDPRVLRGYVTRQFLNAEHVGWRPQPSYELDMPAPRGLSGAPRFAHGRGEALLSGIVYGAHSVDTVEAWSTYDESGTRVPEVVHSVSFGLALQASALADLTGPATGGRRLAEVLAP